MAQLTSQKIRPFGFVQDANNVLPMAADTTIYEGSAVGLIPSSTGEGFARQLAAEDRFAGFAVSTASNAGGSAGDATVQVIDSGSVEVPITSLTQDDVGKMVYASDGDTFTLTESTNTPIGPLRRLVRAGVGLVRFDVLLNARLFQDES